MLTQNQILNHTYQILQPIGSGGTSSVHLAYHLRLQKYVVIKKLQGSFSDDFLFRTEVDILKNLHHPNLPQVYDFFQDHNEIYTVIDFVDGYDLDSYIKAGTRFSEDQLKHYLRQIAEVLDYLHTQEIPVIHSDIKPGNIILNNGGRAILIDFNTSIGENQGNLLGLTLPYASPEQIQLARYAVCGQQAPFALDGRSDLFSLGATFYELISGICPTPGQPPAPLHTMGLTGYSRDFLVLIDRLIEYDRDKRPKSAKKLMAAIDRLDSRYRKHFALRCASVLVSAAFIAGGLYCCIRGVRRENTELYRTYYQQVTQQVDQGNLDKALELCDEILASEKLQAYLQDSPMELARFYHEMGDIYYYRENHRTACQYYRYAVHLCDTGAQDTRNLYLRDAAIAAAQDNDLDTAAALLQQAQSGQAGTDDLALIAVVIEARKGNIRQCEETVRQLLEREADREVCLRAVLALASATKELDRRIEWLLIAQQYDYGRTATRGLAVAYGEKAQQANSAVEQKAALREAAALYETICSSVYASSTDLINYSVILRMSGKTSDALQILKTADGYDPGNYRILANMCFIYYEMRDEGNASAHCEAAIKAWRAYDGADKLSETSEEIQNLLEIGKRFGIGGA